MLSGLVGKLMEYDGENRPLSVTLNGKKTCYVYGADGSRLKKIEGFAAAANCNTAPTTAQSTTLYAGPIEVRNWKTATEAIFAYPLPNIRLVYDGGTTYATALHRDALGTVRGVTEFTTVAAKHGKMAERSVFRPYGEALSTDFNPAAANESKGFIGERYDGDAGLQYLNARYYDPKLAMFIQPDWWEVTKAGVGTNRYSYSFDDPVNKSDVTGHATGCAQACSKETHDENKDLGIDLEEITGPIGALLESNPAGYEIAGAIRGTGYLLGRAASLLRIGGKIEQSANAVSKTSRVFADAPAAPPPAGGPVVFKAPPGATAEELSQIEAYCRACDNALSAGQLSETGRVSTAGTLRVEANAAARAERIKAEKAGVPYSGHAGHAPDTTWTGAAEPPSWIDLTPRLNSSLGGQAAHYPVGYMPTGFQWTPQ